MAATLRNLKSQLKAKDRRKGQGELLQKKKRKKANWRLARKLLTEYTLK